MTLETLNSLFLKNLNQQVDPLEWELYLKSIKIIKTTDTTVLIFINSEFIKTSIEEKYLPVLQSNLDALLNQKMQIELITVPADSSASQSEALHSLSSASIKSNEPLTPYEKTGLNPRYSFDNFVIGENSSFAANAGISISKTKGSRFDAYYNPLLLYGGVGLGKTHLIQAIGNAVYQNDKTKKIIYISAESLMNEYTNSLALKKMEYFRIKYRTVDVLLIDDIHFFENSEHLQEELFYIFNALYTNDKQIVFTCDRPIEKLKNITDRLRSRFSSGINIDLHPPKLETRIAILKLKFNEARLKNPQLTIEEGVYEYIAEQIESNVRDLEANFKTIIAYTELINHNEVTLKTAQDKIKANKKDFSAQKIEYQKIMLSVCNYFNIMEKDLSSKRGSSHITRARLWYYYLVDKLTELSRTEIGKTVNKNHSTVIAGINKISELITVSSMDQIIEKELIDKIYDRQ